MTPHHEKRYHPRVSVQWPTVFFTPQFFGHGTVIDVSALAWRIRGSLPLVAGMQLGVLVWPKFSTYFEIEEGTVLWAREKEFALEIYQVRAQDIPAMVRLQQQTLPQDLQSTDSSHEEMIEVSPYLASSGLEAMGPQRPTHCERRKSGRLLAHCHVHYRRTDGHRGVVEEGILKNVSSTGCNIITKAPLEPGHTLTLVLYLSDDQPISLPGTMVCWGRNHRFGLKFPGMTSDERERLEAIVYPHNPPFADRLPLNDVGRNKDYAIDHSTK